MTIVEKIKKSTSSKAFTLYKEGFFYKCYNEDAMVFSQLIKNYKVITKFIKSVGAPVLSLGFPVSEVDKGKISFQGISAAISALSFIEESFVITFILKEDIKKNYTVFKAKQITENLVAAENNFCNNKDRDERIQKMILEFDLANSTPMQSMVFILDLKKLF